jgi:hypothetical protein
VQILHKTDNFSLEVHAISREHGIAQGSEVGEPFLG